MSDYNKNKLANAVLNATSNIDVADAAFRSSKAPTVRAGVVTSGNAVRQGEKLSADRALVIAETSNDSDVLLRMARKESRITVLRTIAGNKNICKDTVLELIRKASLKEDREMTQRLCHNGSTNVQEVVWDQIMEGQKGCCFLQRLDHATRAQALVIETISVGQLRKLVSAHQQATVSVILHRLLTRSIQGISLEEFCQVHAEFSEKGPQINFSVLGIFEELISADTIVSLAEYDVAPVAEGHVRHAAEKPYGYMRQSRGRDLLVGLTSAQASLSLEAVQKLAELANSSLEAGTISQGSFWLTGFAMPVEVSAQRQYLTALLELHQAAPNVVGARETVDAVSEMIQACQGDIYDVDDLLRTLVDNTSQEVLRGVLDHSGALRSLLAGDTSDFAFEVLISNSKTFLELYINPGAIGKKYFAGSTGLQLTTQRMRILSDLAAAGNDIVDSAAARVYIRGMMDLSIVDPCDFLGDKDAFTERNRKFAEFAPAFVDLLGDELLYAMGRSPFVYSEMERYLGSNAEMWETLFGMAEGIEQQPLSSLLNGIRVICGGDPLPTALELLEGATYVAGEVATTADEVTVSNDAGIQMSLLS